MTGALPRKTQSGSLHRCNKIFQSFLQVVVDYNKIELANMPQFAQCGSDAALDYQIGRAHV